jgi:hypothetical protein
LRQRQQSGQLAIVGEIHCWLLRSDWSRSYEKSSVTKHGLLTQ